MSVIDVVQHPHVVRAQLLHEQTELLRSAHLDCFVLNRRTRAGLEIRLRRNENTKEIQK